MRLKISQMKSTVPAALVFCFRMWSGVVRVEGMAKRWLPCEAQLRRAPHGCEFAAEDATQHDLGPWTLTVSPSDKPPHADRAAMADDRDQLKGANPRPGVRANGDTKRGLSGRCATNKAKVVAA
jgi:hypothetical protein